MVVIMVVNLHLISVWLRVCWLRVYISSFCVVHQCVLLLKLDSKCQTAGTMV